MDSAGLFALGSYSTASLTFDKLRGSYKDLILHLLNIPTSLLLSNEHWLVSWRVSYITLARDSVSVAS